MDVSAVHTDVQPENEPAAKHPGFGDRKKKAD